ncbi:MAG: metallophosphoesterase [Candidatus Staskawiczbacteria bacterium]|jgi:putative phosphoesterase
MKIAIVSDTHNNWANFKKAIEWIKKEKIQLILHCGDISSREMIDDAKKFFDGEIKFVKGNADWEMDLPEKMEMEPDGKKIGMVHFPDQAKKMAQSGKYDLVFYGHTHRAWDEKVGNCHMINPGELAGQFYKPTFAVYDTATGNMELKILEKLF